MQITITITANKDDAADFIKKVINGKVEFKPGGYITTVPLTTGDPPINPCTTPHTIAERSE